MSTPRKPHRKPEDWEQRLLAPAVVIKKPKRNLLPLALQLEYMEAKLSMLIVCVELYK
jgi:hypothetical protein